MLLEAKENRRTLKGGKQGVSSFNPEDDREEEKENEGAHEDGG
jgi:hypothetical protein